MIEKYKDLGTFNFESRIPDGEGIRVLKKFLENLTIEIGNNTAKQIRTTEYPPSFAYHEKQLHTVIAPAMDKIADNFLMESPVNRNWSKSVDNKKNAHGWVDYWCEYKDYCYYIELKHGFRSYKSKKDSVSVKKDWSIAHEQLNTLADEINLEKEYSKGIFRILFHVLPIFLQSSSKIIQCGIEIDDLINQQVSSMNEISELYQSNWSVLWKPNDDLCKEYPTANGFVKFPAILILANISEIQKL